MSWLVDTNVVSELVRPRPNAGVVAWAGARDRLVLSAVTVEEIAFGLALRPNRRVEDWMEVFLRERCDVVPIDGVVARLAGRLRGRLQAAGRTRTQADMLVAASASVRGAVVVTRNVRDFDGCEVEVWSPFT